MGPRVLGGSLACRGSLGFLPPGPLLPPGLIFFSFGHTWKMQMSAGEGLDASSRFLAGVPST